MTQPRKEQVKNLKTKYTRFTGVGTLSIGGGPVQTVSNTGLEAFYDNFLTKTKTGIVGGAETSAPGILYGGSGPFNVNSGDVFILNMAGVGDGFNIGIHIQVGDVVTLGGVPVVTTSRMVARINQDTAGVGVLAPIASNVNGQLVLSSAGITGVLTGDEAVISVFDQTPGILNALGFTVTSSISAQGTTAPKRGLITASADGLGGYVQMRKLDTAVPDVVNSVMRHVMTGKYVPETLQGQPVFARLQAFPGPVLNGRNLRFSFFRNGPVRPQVVTSSGTTQANFSTLTGADIVAVFLDFGNGQTLSFNVAFNSVTTVQDVVDRFNGAYSAASLAATAGQLDSTQPSVVFGDAAPYRFIDPTTQGSFFFKFESQAVIHFNPPAGMYSASDLVTYVNAAISTAGQSAFGQATTYVSPSGAVYLAIVSLNTDVTASAVGILPGNPGGSSPGSYMGTLDQLGLVPGSYRAGTAAELFGLDEVNLHCPSALPGAQMTISGPLPVMTKLGLPSGVNVTSSNGVQPVVSPSSHLLVPEMVEFHEERDDYDSITQDFGNKAPFGQLKPQDGASNVGLDQLLSPDGKINPSMIPRILDFIGVDRMKLGSRMLNNITDSLLTPKISASHDASGGGFANLLFESTVDSSSHSKVLRIYTVSDSIYVTQNAKIVQNLGSSSAFARDSASDSSMVEYGGLAATIKLSTWPSTAAATWGLTDWKSNVLLDSKGGSATGDLLRLGEFLTGSSSDALKPRLATPVGNDLVSLIYEGRAPTGMFARLYLKVTTSNQVILRLTFNAKFDGANYAKDQNGQRATLFEFAGQSLSFTVQGPDGAWGENSWAGPEQIGLSFNTLIARLGGTLVLGNALTDPTVPMLQATRFTPNTNRRVLLFESPVNGPFALVPIRLYLVTTSSTMKDGFQFTYNAHWNQGLDKFVQDVPSEKSYSWSFQQDRFWMLSKLAGSGNWGEDFTLWDTYALLDAAAASRGWRVRDGVFQVDSPTSALSNPVKTNAPLLNAVYAKTMVKSWGTGNYISSAPTIVDGYNASAIGVNAFAWDMFYASGFGGTPATMLGVQDGSSAQGGTQRAVAKVFTHVGFSRIILVITDYNGNFFPQATVATVSHVTYSQT